MIDDEHFDGPALRFELQSELILQGAKDRRSIGWRGRGIAVQRKRRPIGCPLEIEREESREARAIDDDVLHDVAGEVNGEVAHGHIRRRQLARRRSRLAAGRFREAIGGRGPNSRSEGAVFSRKHKCKPRKLPRLAVHLQLEAIFKQRLQQRAPPCNLLRRRAAGKIVSDLRDNVVPVRVRPIGAADDLRRQQTPAPAHLIRDGDERPHVHADGAESAAWLKPECEAGIDGRIPFDGCNLERRPWRRLLTKKQQKNDRSVTHQSSDGRSM